MGRGRAVAGLGLLLAGLVLLSTAGTAADRLIVDEQELERGVPAVVHVVLDSPVDPPAGTVDVTVTVEGPVQTRERAATHELSGPGEQLVTVTWTPDRVGEHALVAKANVSGTERVIGERNVTVTMGPSQAGSSLPDTAPGTVQWAIAFGILFFVARAGLHHRSGD